MKAISGSGRKVGAHRGAAVLVGAWALGSAPVTWGQSAALESLKKSHEEEVSKTVLPLREGYRKALLALEAQLASKGDYAGAKAVQQERREMDRLTAHAPASTAPAPPPDATGVVRLGAFAESGGGVVSESGSWTGWQAAGGFVRWVLPAGLRGGGYALELVYASPAAGELALTVREDFHTLNRQLKIIAADAPGGPGPEGRATLGTLRLRPGATLLEVKLPTATPLTGFKLIELKLIPEANAS
ncbi:MAG: hypothetical protein JWL81_2423 [Verrucomicrobiales bacterium]|nr:hypothetical protein [Verrucomicrobiales bacterium]